MSSSAAFAPADRSPAEIHAPERLAPADLAFRRRLPDWVSRLVFGKPLAPTPSEWQQLQLALGHGDPAMDALVDWMFEAGPRQAKPLFEQALHQGIDSVPNPPAPLQAFFAVVDNAPSWLNRAQLETGAQAAHLSGPVAIYVLRDMALMGGYAYFYSMNQTLARTGALSKDITLRLGETGKWLNDVTEPGGMSRFGAGFTTTIRVRLVHALVRRNLLNKPDWEASKWGVPINQVDMLATYLAFGPVTLLGARLFGVPYRPKQAADVMHMWRYIGWLMGVEDQWLARSEMDGLRKLHHCFLTHRLPDDRIRQLGQALRDEP
ncbi:MAG TPA: oxygenase MpaB family protein, partial [Dongiaceae bacterium]|nr:oxygenase MpaB family protein [Dongiaceae bacterium]